jgi:hypothetical protein
MNRNGSNNQNRQGRHGSKRPQNRATPPRSTASSAQQLYSEDEFEQLGFSIMRRDPRGAQDTRERQFVSHFGLNSGLFLIVWRELAESGWLEFASRKAKPEHLLWCLLFLNTYNVEELNATLAGTSERTFREKVWFYAKGIANLDRKLVSCT